MTGNILNIKINIPPLNTTLLERPSLLNRLDKNLTNKEGFNRHLTLISAPAGFGKTTLARSWLSGREAHTAWYSLDQNDNERERFWLYIVSALQKTEPGLGKGSLEMLRSSALESEAAAGRDSLLTPLLNDLFALKESLYLCIDDYHIIDNRQIHQDMAFFIENLPPTIHLVITTRSEPPWPLARWRVRNMMIEARQKELRFTRDEAGQLLAGVNELELNEPQVEALYKKTEGWVTGLQLAAISLSDNPDTAAFISNFTGSHRHVFHFLSEEVFQRQPENVQGFLLDTSILQRLSASLCNRVSGRGDSAALLAELDRKNLFLIALDEEGTWYRYHPLFADLLLHQLTKTSPEKVKELHESAAKWFLEHDEPGEAVRHALSGENLITAAKVLNDNLEEIVAKEGSKLVNTCLEKLPARFLKEYPLLSIHKAWFHLIHEGREDAKEILDISQEAVRDIADGNDAQKKELSGMVSVVDAYYNIFTHNFTAALESAEKALTALSAENTYWRSKVGVISGDARLFSGNPKEAYHYYLEAHRNNLAYGNTYLAMSTGFKVATALHYRGRLAEAEQVTREVIETIKEEGLSRLPRAGLLWTLLGDYHRETGSMKEAERCIERSLHLSETEKPSHGWNYLYKIAYLYSKNLYSEAMEAISKLEKLHQEVVLPNFIVMPMTAWKALLYLKIGSRDKARAALDKAGINEGKEIIGGQERCYLALARVMISDGDEGHKCSLELFNSIEAMAARGENQRLLIETLIARAELAWQRNDKDQAEEVLLKALKIGYPNGYFRVFVDESRELARLYQHCLSRKGKGILAENQDLADYAQNIYRNSPDAKILDQELTVEKDNAGKSNIETTADDNPQYQGLIEELSKRELEILELFQQGLSNKQIADKIFLSPGTVKWHASNIYGKLGVRGKLQAVALARKLKLIS